jgi:hypothetical protein
MSRIRLTIEALALRGFDGADGRALVEELRSEVARVLAEPVTRAEWTRSHRTPILRLGRIALESGSAGSRKLGKGMAHAIVKGLKP